MLDNSGETLGDIAKRVLARAELHTLMTSTELGRYIITQIYFNSSKYTFPVLALHKDRIGRDMNPSEFVY